jgi:hypothetical protein
MFLNENKNDNNFYFEFLRFFLASFYTRHDSHHFVLNFVSMGFVVVPKLPQFHLVRLFGINKYWILSRQWVQRRLKTRGGPRASSDSPNAPLLMQIQYPIPSWEFEYQVFYI